MVAVPVYLWPNMAGAGRGLGPQFSSQNDVTVALIEML